ncbi:MAG: ABC transporter permease [Clostridia bacterium]|nr:ABC transporter permease [Clostridia bacterium]
MYMFKYILKRLGLLVFTYAAILLICFTLIKLLPLPDIKSFGQDANLIEMRRELLGYNKPIIEQFGIFLKAVFTRWDWGVGEQIYRGQEVADVFASKVPATVLLNIYTTIIAVPIGLGFGIFAALRKNKIEDHIISTGVMIMVSVPSYVYAFLVQYVFCFKLGWFPFQMEASTDYLSWSMFVSMCPAILSLSFGTIAGYTRGTRAELSEVLTNEFMLLARTKGLTKSQAVMRHAMRNAMVVIFPSILAEFIGVLAGSVVIERIFSIPGLGGLYIDAINNIDYNFFMMLTAFYSFIGLLANIVLDISISIIDPRIRMGAR